MAAGAPMSSLPTPTAAAAAAVAAAAAAAAAATSPPADSASPMGSVSMAAALPPSASFASLVSPPGSNVSGVAGFRTSSAASGGGGGGGGGGSLGDGITIPALALGSIGGGGGGGGGGLGTSARFYGGAPAPLSARSTASEVPLARKQALAAISANKAASKPSNVVVGVRSRPLNDLETSMGDEDAWVYEPEHGVLYERREGPTGAAVMEHTYDFVFPPATHTSEVYTAMGVPIVNAALEGYNGTLFAYGQTGSGKTYTLMGTAEEPGMTILAVHDVFKRIEESVDTEFLVRVSYIELYQEEIRDLFNPDAGTLKIVDNPMSGPYVKGLTEEVVLSPERVLELMAIGEANRHVAATNMNLRSSRSHTLFKVRGGGGGGGGGAVCTLYNRI